MQSFGKKSLMMVCSAWWKNVPVPRDSNPPRVAWPLSGAIGVLWSVLPRCIGSSGRSRGS